MKYIQVLRAGQMSRIPLSNWFAFRADKQEQCYCGIQTLRSSHVVDENTVKLPQSAFVELCLKQHWVTNLVAFENWCKGG